MVSVGEWVGQSGGDSSTRTDVQYKNITPTSSVFVTVFFQLVSLPSAEQCLGFSLFWDNVISRHQSDTYTVKQTNNQPTMELTSQ